jgi:hypothetical protein
MQITVKIRKNKKILLKNKCIFFLKKTKKINERETVVKKKSGKKGPVIKRKGINKINNCK